MYERMPGGTAVHNPFPLPFPPGASARADGSIQDGTTTTKTFVHTPSIIEAEEAEEIGVEHLLRDIRDVAVGTLSTRVTSQLQSLQGLHLRLRDIGRYLQKVLDRELPVNHAILGNLQDVFNLLPNLSTPKADDPSSTEAVIESVHDNGSPTDNGELARAMSIKTNDQLMTIYLSSLIRAITAFHDLIDNKIQNRQQHEEKETLAKKDETKPNGVATAVANGDEGGNQGPSTAPGAADGDKDHINDSSEKNKRSDGQDHISKKR